MDLRHSIDYPMALGAFGAMVMIDAETGNELKLAEEVIRRVKRFFPDAEASYDGCTGVFPAGHKSNCPGNLIVNIPGSSDMRDRPVVGFNAHLDRVKPGYGVKPIVSGDRVASSGDTILAADDVAGIAVILAALEAISGHTMSHPPLQLIFTLSEEVKILGARHLNKSLLRAAEIFSFDGEEANVIYRGSCASHKYRIKITGKLAHAGVEPEKGVSAPLIFSLATADLYNQGLFGACRGRDASVNLNVVGFREVGTNSVQDELLVTGEARSFENSELEGITVQVQRAFNRAAKMIVSSDNFEGRIDFEVDRAYHAFILPADHPTVLRAARAIERAGLKPVFCVVRGGFDANWLNAHGVPTVALGMGARKAHTKEEYLLTGEFRQACEVCLALALGE